MAELGYMDDPGNRMGLLDGQSLRAARVVIDIGVHCGFEAPAEVGGGEWTYDKAWQFLTAHANMDEGFLRFELDRYLGWPGQAPSLQDRRAALAAAARRGRAREGDAFDIKAFHRRALDIGGVGLDTLRTAVARLTPLPAAARPDAPDLRGFPVACRHHRPRTRRHRHGGGGAGAAVQPVRAAAADAGRAWWRSFLPFVPEVHLSSEVVLVGLLPPLLYAAAIRSSLVDFKENRRADRLPLGRAGRLHRARGRGW